MYIYSFTIFHRDMSWNKESKHMCSHHTVWEEFKNTTNHLVLHTRQQNLTKIRREGRSSCWKDGSSKSVCTHTHTNTQTNNKNLIVKPLTPKHCYWFRLKSIVAVPFSWHIPSTCMSVYVYTCELTCVYILLKSGLKWKLCVAQFLLHVLVDSWKMNKEKNWNINMDRFYYYFVILLQSIFIWGTNFWLFLSNQSSWRRIVFLWGVWEAGGVGEENRVPIGFFFFFIFLNTADIKITKRS